jgi:anthranilate synthase component 1
MTAEPLIVPLQLERASLLKLHAAFPERYPALLESAASGRPLGCYDILFAYPRDTLVLNASGRRSSSTALPGQARTFLEALDAWFERERTSAVDVPLPFRGGWFLFLGYELASEIEPRLQLPRPTTGPIAAAVRVPAGIVFEHESQQAWIVAEADAHEAIEWICADVDAIARVRDAAPETLIEEKVLEDLPERFIVAVERALEYIAAGDIYQANLSRAWRAKAREGVRAHHIYRRLRETNPAPFAALAAVAGLTIVSSSPERLVCVDTDRQISTRPIAGTRPRGADAGSDQSLAQELRAHPKERAEHVMLLDLERNDLGRICAAGTVEVNELMVLESYAHVHHIVSNVRGRLRPEIRPGEVLRAVFPGGTITGCPKIRCMQIIAELEGEPRGAYTGSLGYLNRDGSMDMNILIRSLELDGRDIVLRAGAGIVADSVPRRELEETRAKARGVLRALSRSEDAT